MLCGHMNILSMKYRGVSGCGIQRKCHSMVGKGEKQLTVGMRQRCFNTWFSYYLNIKKWKIALTLPRALCFLSPGHCIDTISAKRRDIMSLLVKHNGRVSFDTCGTMGVLGSYAYHLLFGSTKDDFQRITFRL